MYVDLVQYLHASVLIGPVVKALTPGDAFPPSPQQSTTNDDAHYCDRPPPSRCTCRIDDGGGIIVNPFPNSLPKGAIVFEIKFVRALRPNRRRHRRRRSPSINRRHQRPVRLTPPSPSTLDRPSPVPERVGRGDNAMSRDVCGTPPKEELTASSSEQLEGGSLSEEEEDCPREEETVDETAGGSRPARGLF